MSGISTRARQNARTTAEQSVKTLNQRGVPEAPAQGPALDVLEEHLELGAARAAIAQRIRERLERSRFFSF